MRVGKWGDSLAVPLPAEVVEALQLKEGDEVAVEVGEDGSGRITRTPTASEALAELRVLRRPFPPDYRFSRDEANERSLP